MIKRKIKKVVVLGSGLMGTGIACHLANAGIQVLLLDMIPEGAESGNRNILADQAIRLAKKLKPSPIYDGSFLERIHVGNFDDDLSSISDYDWIIEVIVENLEIKKGLYEKVEKYRKPGSLITSNTSGIPLIQLVKGRSEDFASNFCGTHFFNPVRYMSLLEIIPHDETNPDIVDFLMQYGDKYLGKKTVLCKDTPGFIANRIGFYSGNKVNELTNKYNLTIEEVDKLTSQPIGWPNTGSFRLLDLVGIDTSVKVTKGVIANCPEDEFVAKIRDQGTPLHLEHLIKNNWLGNKTGQGYYKKTKDRDLNGRRIIKSFDLKDLIYRDYKKPQLDSIRKAKKIELLDKRINTVIYEEDNGGKFLQELLVGLMIYAANRIPEISENIFSIDEAMKAGYAWSLGPFEMWDIIGLNEGIGMAEKLNESIPKWIYDLRKTGASSFYTNENGEKKYFDLQSQSYEAIPNQGGKLHLDDVRHKQAVYKNSECALHDLGDSVLGLEFTSKSNAIGEGIGNGVIEAIKLAENGDWRGILIGNNAKNFSVGANLMAVGMIAMQKDFNTLEKMVSGFQNINMAMRYSSIPVVTCTQGYVFGGGCEMLMHTEAAVCAAESYIGLVEVGVGLLPGGGGTKEFAKRASESYFEGDTKISTLIDKLKVIATASVATSAYEAYRYGYLSENRDDVEINLSRVLQKGKEKVIQLSDGYQPPVPELVTVLGRGGLATLYTAINEFYLGQYMSEHDVNIARKIAYVLCGGDLTGEQRVTEEYLLEIEKQGFLELLGEQKTLDRIQYMLMNNKPLRN